MILNNNKKLAVVIPALNEEASIALVLESLVKLGAMPIVVNDGSTDATAKIAESFGAIVINHAVNRGYESALNSGFKFGVDNGFDFIATFDADNQLSTEDLKNFCLEADKLKLDLVVGIRNYKNRLSEHFLSYFARLRFGLTDPLCGLKLYRVKSLEKLLPFDTQNLVGMELAFKMADAGLKFTELPISVKKRNGYSRYGTSIKGELKIIKALIKSVQQFKLLNRKSR